MNVMHNNREIIEAVLHVVQMRSDHRLSAGDRAGLAELLGSTYNSNDGSTKGFFTALVQLCAYWRQQQREVEMWLEREFQHDARDDRWRIVAAIRQVKRPRADLSSPSVADADLKLMMEAERQSAPRQLEALVNRPLPSDHVEPIIKNIK
jgi:hypothetical protein